MLTELTDKGRCHDGNNLITLENGLNDLEDLALIHNGTKGTGNQALSTGNTLVLIDHRAALIIGTDGIHTAGGGAGALQMDNGVVRTGLGALAALDAFRLINVRLAVFELDSALGADLFAGTGKAVLAVLGDLILVGGAGMAGIGNGVDQRRLIILLRNRGMIHTLGDQMAAIRRTKAQAHSKAHTLTGNGPLQKNRLTVQRAVAGNNDVGQLLCLGIVAAVISHASDLSKDLFSDIRDQRRDSTHCMYLLNSYEVLFSAQEPAAAPDRRQ